MKLLLEIKEKAVRSKIISFLFLIIQQLQLFSIILTSIIPSLFQSLISLLIILNQQAVATIIYVLILILIIAIYIITLIGVVSNSLIGKICLRTSANIINLFPYLLYIPCLNICFQALSNQKVLATIQNELFSGIFAQILSGLVILLSTLLVFYHQYSNWSNRLIEKDFCNSRSNSYLNVAFIIIIVGSSNIFGSFYASFILILRALYILQRLFQTYNYQMIQKFQAFFCLLDLQIATWSIVTQFNQTGLQQSFQAFGFFILLSCLMCYFFSQVLIDYINTSFLLKKKPLTQSQKDQNDVLPQNQNKVISCFENNLRLTIKGLLQKKKMKNGKNNQYDKWWRFLTQKIVIHKLNCQKVKCYCKRNQDDYQQIDCEQHIIINDLQEQTSKNILENTKEIKLKILNIYLFNQISKKPLKSFYEIMRLKREKVNMITQIDLQCLVNQTRQCFDQIFKKNKVQNQELQLLKVISYEQITDSLEKILKQLIQSIISFLYQFTYATVKISAVQSQSSKIRQSKIQFEKIIESTIMDYTQNKNIQILIFVFYHFIEVYKSRQAQFKKISNQQLMKKRIYQKSQVNIFNPENGSIYIDLIEDRGKIKKITKNLTQVFGYSRQDMISFNINLFMPRIYGRYHRRFLSNFVEKGQIKLLKEKQRVVFGKNKKKFIFPVNVRLKTQHLLQNQFGATALLTPLKTSSDYVILSRNGKIQQMTQGIFKKIFKHALKDEIGKVNRLCFYKMLLGLISKFQKSENNYFLSNKVHEGLLIFSDFDDILFQKFRHSKQNAIQSITGNNGTISANSSSRADFSASSVLSGLSQNSLTSLAGIQQENSDYFGELFKYFLNEINIFRLKGAKVTYKISKLKTSEFQLQLIELTSFKEISNQKQFYIQAIYEFFKAAEILGINETQSSHMKYLSEIQNAIQKDQINQFISSHQALFLKKNEKKSKTDRSKIFNVKSKQTEKMSAVDQHPKKRASLDQKSQIFQENDDSDVQLFEGQQQANINIKGGNSQQSSIVGNTQNESKKQILVNAFNSKESAISFNLYFFTNLIIIIVLILKIFMGSKIFAFSDDTIKFWNDNVYIHQLSQLFQFRISLEQIQQTYQLKNLTKPYYLDLQKMDLNSKLTEKLRLMNDLTYQQSINNRIYAQQIILQHPIFKTKMQMTFPQLFNYFQWVFIQNQINNKQILFYNYEKIHNKFLQFNNKQEDLIKQKQNEFMLYLYITFVAYQIGIIILAIGAFPLYRYYKNQQKFLLGLLSFMSAKQVNKLLEKLKKLNQYMNISKQSIRANKIQNQLNDKKFSKQQDKDGAQTSVILKPIKIAEQAQQGKNTVNSRLLLILLIFIVFFSIISISLLAFGKVKNDLMHTAIQINNMDYKLEGKPPLLVNIYFNQFNRLLKGQPLLNFSDSIYNQTITGYFQILQKISSKQIGDNLLTSFLYDTLTKKICDIVDCLAENINKNFHPNLSFIYLNMNLKGKFDYWHPSNNIPITESQINKWIQQNNIMAQLQTLHTSYRYSSQTNKALEIKFIEKSKELKLIIMILVIIMIPLNILFLFLLEFKFFNFLSGILKEAEEIYTNFHYTILIENTYLTSYFNSKIKQNK